MIHKQFLSLLFVFAAGIAFAQQWKIPFEKFSVAEGLPEEVTITPIQDDKGFIWFGTQNGLVKYDGYSFKVFKASSDKTDSTSLHRRSLWGGLIKANDGKIWMAGESIGITCFDPITEQFRNYYPLDDLTNDVLRGRSALYFEDEAANIWFQGATPLNAKQSTYRLNTRTGIVKEYPIAAKFGANVYLKDFGFAESSATVWLLDDKNNLLRLDRQKDSFEIMIPAGKDILPTGLPDTIRWLSKARNNRLLLSGLHGVYIFDSQTQKIEKSYVHKPQDPNGIPDSTLYALQAPNGQIWVVHRKGTLSLIDPVSDHIQTFTYGSNLFPYQHGITEVRFFFVVAQNEKSILFQTWSGERRSFFFIQYDYTEKRFRFYDYRFNLPGNPLPQYPYPYTYLQDRTGIIWLGTRPGLYKQAPKKKQMDLFRFRKDDPGGLPSDSVRCLFEDSKKRMWVGTTNGLALYQPDKENFKVFRNHPSNASSISNNVITTVQEDAYGQIWVGTHNGLNLWQESTDNFSRLFFSPTETHAINFLFPDKQQRLWLSVRNKGVYVLDKNTYRIIKNFIPDTENPASLTSTTIDVFYQDSRGTIWLGDSGENAFGLYRLNAREDGFTHFLPKPGDSSSISSNEIIFLAEDGKQRLWIGTDGGLSLYQYDKNIYTVFKNEMITSTNCFTTDKNGAPWFGTYSSGGLVFVDVDKGIISSFDESKGLLHNDLIGGQNGRMVKDALGRFWLPTQRGLSVFDPENKSFISYYEKDGFQPYDRGYVGINTSNGDVWIGSNHGLNRIVPANLLKKDTTPPSLVITQVTINDSLFSKPDGTIFKQSVAYTNAIELKYWQKDIRFVFVALHYLRAEDNLYSWTLENYDTGWSTPSKEREASYTNLSPGKYIFRVKASNADGIWNEEGTSITITILPPWWRTWWAYLVYALVFLGALRIFSKWRERNLRTKNELLERKIEERTNSLKTTLDHLQSTQAQLIQSEKMASLGELTAGIAHEIQNPLNFVNNFSEINAELSDEILDAAAKGDLNEVKTLAVDIKSNQEKIREHGKRADSIVKGMLQHSRSSTGVKEPTDINKLVDEYIRLAYHGMRAKDKSFNVTVKTTFDPSLPLVPVVAQDIGRVLLNLFNNAFYAVGERKAMEGDNFIPEVRMETSLSGDLSSPSINITVRDNGNGIPEAIKDKIFQPFFTTKPTGQGTGLGLSLSYDIVKAHGGELKLTTSEGVGSSFTISLPL